MSTETLLTSILRDNETCWCDPDFVKRMTRLIDISRENLRNIRKGNFAVLDGHIAAYISDPPNFNPPYGSINITSQLSNTSPNGTVIYGVSTKQRYINGKPVPTIPGFTQQDKDSIDTQIGLILWQSNKLGWHPRDVFIHELLTPSYVEYHIKNKTYYIWAKYLAWIVPVLEKGPMDFDLKSLIDKYTVDVRSVTREQIFKCPCDYWKQPLPDDALSVVLSNIGDAEVVRLEYPINRLKAIQASRDRQYEKEKSLLTPDMITYHYFTFDMPEHDRRKVHNDPIYMQVVGLGHAGNAGGLAGFYEINGYITIQSLYAYIYHIQETTRNLSEASKYLADWSEINTYPVVNLPYVDMPDEVLFRIHESADNESMREKHIYFVNDMREIITRTSQYLPLRIWTDLRRKLSYLIPQTLEEERSTPEDSYIGENPYKIGRAHV